MVIYILNLAYIKKGELHDPEIKNGQTQLMTQHRKVIFGYHKVTYLLVLKFPSLVRVAIQVSVSPEVVQVTGTHYMDAVRKTRASINFKPLFDHLSILISS
jgi:hypothetical protein